MSDATSIQLLRPRPLLTADAAALLADVAPQAAWQPTHVLEIPTDTTSSSVSGTSLASAGDVWRILLAPPSAMANSVFYPVALRATFLCGDVVGFDDFFELTAGFAIEKPEARSWAWDTVAGGIRWVIHLQVAEYQPRVPRLPCHSSDRRWGVNVRECFGRFHAHSKDLGRHSGSSGLYTHRCPVAGISAPDHTLSWFLHAEAVF